MKRIDNQLQTLSALYHQYRHHLMLTLLQVGGVFVALEGFTIVVLHILSRWRKHRQRAGGFPHLHFSEIRVGENYVRLYDYGQDLYDAMLAAIDAAEESIYLETYIWKGDDLLNGLKAAAGRGVEVCVLVPWTSNHPIVDWLMRGNITQCLQAGIHIFGYRTMLHAKTCTIDGQWSTIGTANLDRLSSVGNYEINVEVYSEALARQMETLFTNDLTNADEILLEQWRNRPWYSLLCERLLSPLCLLT